MVKFNRLTKEYFFFVLCLFFVISNIIFLNKSRANEAETKAITIWYYFNGSVNEKFVEIINQFNRRPEVLKANIKVVPYNKSSYEQTFIAGLTAVGTKAPRPHILQVSETNHLDQSHSKAFRPLNKLSKTPSKILSPDHFISFLSAYYKNPEDKAGLYSLPFNTSTVVLFYNKDAFRKAGLNPENPPNTWEAFEKMARVLKSNGYHSILASGWLTGHHIDDMGALHNEPVATQGNGLDGNHAKLVVNSSFFVQHLNKLSQWYRNGFFSLETGKKAEEAFAKGEIMMLTRGSSRLSAIEKSVDGRFEIGVGRFPYWGEKVKEPQNTIAVGSSFFVLEGHPEADYVWIQHFFEYLTSAEVQIEWQKSTGYLPLVKEVETLVQAQGFYEKGGLKGNTAKVAFDSFAKNTPKEYTRGILLPEFHKIRQMMAQEMKEAIKGHKSAQDALDQIVVLGNKMITDANHQWKKSE